ncbi:MAG: hypothetical protein KW788_05250 [Candidatus Doudnabacteria bacterium]|nr:hypothetical protein [Candidatus Doudnabacteria bacterium]
MKIFGIEFGKKKTAEENTKTQEQATNMAETPKPVTPETPPASDNSQDYSV